MKQNTLTSVPSNNKVLTNHRQLPPTLLHRVHPFLVTRILAHLNDQERHVYSEFDPRFARQEAPKTGPGSNNDKKTMFVPVTFADPVTLLARLNTRRLGKRIQYLRKANETRNDEAYYYPVNKTTEEIAMTEWQRLLQDAREQKQTNYIPSPYELLLFSPCPRSVTVLASYPRSGNSLVRNLFERTTLRVTGSDMRGGLTQHDLVGEAAVGANMVQFVKTHFPERRGQPPFQASRVVLLVRNPYDAIESFFNLMMTNTHTTSVSEEQRQQYDKLWEEHVLKEIQVWKAFHEYWLAQEIPMLLVKYEDLIRFPDKVMARITQFVLEINNMTFFDNRITRCISEEEKIEQLGSYRPRSGGIGKSLSRYSPDLLQMMNVGILATMEMLGYDEMLVPKPDEWELEPVDDYGAELFTEGNEKKEITINAGKLVRSPKTSINWRRVRRIMNRADGDAVSCQCYQCRNNT